ncbi:MAG: hypothetical protein EOP35_17695, partial [Rubrivivax sp.]
MTDASPPRPYLDPTQQDHNAPRPPQPPPAAWQQASHRPRTAPVRRAVPLPPRERRPGYITSHWHGEQGLVRSYWVNNFLVATPLAFLLTGLMGWIGAKGDSLQLSAIAVLIGFPMLMALDVWCIVGAWRSATNYLRDHGS